MKNTIKIMWTSQEQWLEKHGDETWAMICDHIKPGVWFTVSDCVGLLPPTKGRYGNMKILAVLRNVEAQGKGVVKRHGNSFMI